MAAKNANNDEKRDGRAEQIRNDYLIRCEAIIKYLAPDHFTQLWSSKDSIFVQLGSADGNTRAAAIYCGFSKWGLGKEPEFQSVCQRIAVNDQEQAQLAAICVLGNIFFGTKRLDVVDLLMSVLRGDTLPGEVQNAVQQAVRQIEHGFEYDSVLEAANAVLKARQ